MKPFLTAHWLNLALLTYRIPAGLLLPHLPPGCELDLHHGDAFASLVAFDFRHTRVHGIPWPGFRNFPEINLRFYVRSGNLRGVCFIREFVPQRLIAALARRLYNEPYLAAKMSSRTTDTPTHLTLHHQLTYRSQTHILHLTATKPASLPPPDSLDHFLKEHEWGFGIDKNNRPLRYQVTHPLWQTYPIESFSLNWNWSQVYGPEWSCLQNTAPHSVILAAGSPITVSPPALLSPQ